MPARKPPSPPTVAEVRLLPWPSAIRAKDTPLTVADCYRVGQLVIERLDWTETRGRQEWSLRRLQGQVLKNASVSTLSRCVRVYRIARELGLSPPWKNLDMRHFVATAALSPAKRKQLLQKVEQQGWSVVKLEDHVKANYGSPGRGGKSTVECVRALENLEKRDLFSDLNRLNVYSRADLRKIAKRVDAAEATFRKLRQELKAMGV
ncbi:MAG: hypothetical protein RJA70_888 [Pseudomonadota bacterium]|jgi:hypothetical protein